MNQSKEFLHLQREWYSRLAETGFVDIEWLGPSGELRLSSTARDTIKNYKSEQEGYYDFCRSIVESGTLHTGGLAYEVIRLLSEGRSYREIAAELPWGLTKDRVARIIKKFATVGHLQTHSLEVEIERETEAPRNGQTAHVSRKQSQA